MSTPWQSWPPFDRVEAKVGVICTDPSHEGRTVKVHRFGRAADGTTWSSMRGYRQRPDGLVVAQGVKPDVNVEMRLRGDNPVRDPGPDVRVRWNLTCDLCGLSLTARREKLTPVLDQLAEHGVSVIELAHLIRRVS